VTAKRGRIPKEGGKKNKPEKTTPEILSLI